MYLRAYRKRRGDKTYEYYRLVESYRGPNGKVLQRVIAKFPNMAPAEADNLKQALEANRTGKVLCVAPRKPAPTDETTVARARVLASLRYLDIAVVYAMWKQSGLAAIVRDLLPDNANDVPTADVVAALTIQRCVAPGSKRYAQRWMPRTALPEMLGLKPRQFNNTRIHRALTDLDRASNMLMRRLARGHAERKGTFAALFLDVSDVRFVGQGPDTAQRAKSKEGIYGEKIGVVLLCSEDGMPLRWSVVPGRQHDSKSMGNVFESLNGIDWAAGVPIVCDRAMGKTKQIGLMADSGLHFLTALTTQEFGTYATDIRYEALSKCQLGLRDDTYGDDRTEVIQAAKAAGYQFVRDTMLVLDQGIFEPPVDDDENAISQDPDGHDKTVVAMRQGTAIKELLDNGQATNYRGAGAILGVTKYQAAHYFRLTKLTSEIQQDVLQAKATGLSLADLERVAALPETEQYALFNRLVTEVAPRRDPKKAHRPKVPKTRQKKVSPPRVRVVAVLNPELLIQIRRTLHRHDRAIKEFVEHLNTQLCQPGTRRTRERAVTEVEYKLRDWEARDLYSVTAKDAPTEANPKAFQLRLQRNERIWKNRHRYAGYTVLVAHPDVKLSPARLAKLYREKDQVERDFRIIKSLVEIRPVWHHTDPKVRAHVTLCMLALTLERTIAARLQNAKRSMTPALVLESLEDCRLNRLAIPGHKPTYQVTELDRQQQALLRDLGLEHLADHRELAMQIAPR